MAVNKQAQQANALLTQYTNLYEGRYKTKPTINRYKEKWAMIDVIESVGYDRAKDILEYYFKMTRTGHPLQWYFYNFDRLDETMRDKEKDEEKRAALRAATKARVEEYKEKNESRG